jgi:hypothetical protein
MRYLVLKAMAVEEQLRSPKRANDEIIAEYVSALRTESGPSRTSLTCEGTSGDRPSWRQCASKDTHTQSGLPAAGTKVTTGRPKSCLCTGTPSDTVLAGSGDKANQNNAEALGGVKLSAGEARRAGEKRTQLH